MNPDDLVKVALDIPPRRMFDYLPGKFQGGLVRGVRVRVPFGRQKRIGWVVDFGPSDGKQREYRPIEKVYDEKPLLTDELLELAHWIADYYCCSVGQALAAINRGLALKGGEEEILPIVPVSRDEPPARIHPLPPCDTSAGFHMHYVVCGKGTHRKVLSADMIGRMSDGSALVLCPETRESLRLHAYLSSRFGDRVLLFHGGLSRRERYGVWKRVLEGRRLVVVGTRLAVFSPLRDMSLILVDTPHDSSHREQQTPRYDVEDIAEWRARKNDIPLLTMGEALSVRQYYRAREEKIPVSAMPEAENTVSVHIVKHGGAARKREVPFFSQEVRSLVEKTVLERHRAAIIHNRRGSGRIVLCEKCGHRFECPDCRKPLAVSPREKKMLCRYCDHEVSLPGKCPECGSKKIVRRVYGLEKMRRTLEEVYPWWKIATASGNGKDSPASAECDVILGTRAALKMLDETIYTVVIINGDMFFDFPRFSAEEEFFLMARQIVSRVAPEGALVIQTPNPHLPVYVSLRESKPEIFYEKELETRNQLKYPPFAVLATVRIKAKTEKALHDRAKECETFLEKEGCDFTYSGPDFPPLRAGWHCHRIVLKIQDWKAGRRILADLPVTARLNIEFD